MLEGGIADHLEFLVADGCLDCARRKAVVRYAHIQEAVSRCLAVSLSLFVTRLPNVPYSAY
mgnify:CR=1 FL=1